MFSNPELNKEYVKWQEEEKEWNCGRTHWYSFDYFLNSDAYRKYIGTSTIYSCDNEAERAKLEVPYQKDFTGPSYFLSSQVADTPLSQLSSSKSILSWMNHILRTNRRLTPKMERLFRFCRRTFKDFGQVYACLRPRWHMHPLEALKNIEARQNEDDALRSKALENDTIVLPHCPPRRLWDLPSNRVMPFWALEVRYRDVQWLAISHSWMEEDQLDNISSPTNGYEWPIPIPTNTSLDCIRIELLNVVAEAEAESRRLLKATISVTGAPVRVGMFNPYNVVWLDVVCLRQKGVEANESLRKDEWKLDVPTIGPIYEHVWVVYYFSGLGRPFEAPTNKNDPRHWMNRAWTLQETQDFILVAGRSLSSPKIPSNIRVSDVSSEWRQHMENGDDALKSLMTPFLEIRNFSVIGTLLLMRDRSATSELDKIYGLIYRLTEFKSSIPAYILGEDIEDAWDRLMKATIYNFLLQLFFVFPEPGTGKHIWYPSWRQIRDWDARSMIECWDGCSYSGSFDGDGNTQTRFWTVLEHSWLEGLSDVGSHDNPWSRSGKVHLIDKEGKEHTLSITAYHKTSISDGCYVLVGSFGAPVEVRNTREYSEYWVVARRTEQDFIEKVSTIRFEGVAWSALCDITRDMWLTAVKLL